MKHAPCGVLRGLTTAMAHVRCHRTCRRRPRRAVVGLPIGDALPVAVLGLRLHVNLRTSAPRRTYRARRAILSFPRIVTPRAAPVQARRAARASMSSATPWPAVAPNPGSGSDLLERKV